jgi:hypothetical protein
MRAIMAGDSIFPSPQEAVDSLIEVAPREGWEVEHGDEYDASRSTRKVFPHRAQ